MERVVDVGGVQLCAEAFGDPADPTILLVHGACASMLWWDTELCELLARTRHVIRFDNRDTGRSTAYPPGRPGYSLRDLADDAVGVLDAFGVRTAHLVGRSMAGAIVTAAAVRHPERVASLTLVTTTSGGPGLPPMSEDFTAYTATGPDPDDRDAVVDYITGLVDVYGGRRHFDAEAARALAERDVARTRSVASCLTNHFLVEFDVPVDLGAPATPTLVVHGDRDPVFPLDHGRALAAAIPGAELLVLPDTGHEVPPRTWDVFATALLRHTAEG